MEGFIDIFENMTVFMDFIPNKKSITNLTSNHFTGFSTP